MLVLLISFIRKTNLFRNYCTRTIIPLLQMWPPGTNQLSSLFQCTLGSAYSPLSFSSPVGLNSVRSLGCHLLVFGITQLLPAVRPAVFVCVVCDGKVSDPLVCWGPLHLLSFRSLFLASGKDCGCRAVVVIGMSVSKESVMSTSWFGTVPHSFFFAVPVSLSPPVLSQPLSWNQGSKNIRFSKDQLLDLYYGQL